MMAPMVPGRNPPPWGIVGNHNLMKGCDGMAFNYSKLRGRIREKFSSEGRFADAMEMSKQTLSAKLNNRIQFTQDEIRLANMLLDIPADEIAAYFFAEEVQVL